MTKLSALSFAVFSMCAVGACSMMTSAKSVTSGGEGGGGSKGLAGTMAEAQTYHVGDSVEAPAGCNTSGYMKVDTKAGDALHVDVDIEGPAGTCVNFTWMTSTGSTQPPGKMFGDLCVDKGAHQTLDVEGADGGSFIQVLEDPPCKGANVKIALH